MGKESFHKLYRSHYQDGCHAHLIIWHKPLKSSSDPKYPMLLKFGIDLRGVDSKPTKSK